MGSRHGRHARSRWDDWDSQPSRSAELAPVVAEQTRTEAEPDPRAPGRKDTRMWCKGKVGREHKSALVRRPYLFRVREGGCGWVPAWDAGSREWQGVGWHCDHREECDNCGKVLRDRGSIGRAECPLFAIAGPEQKAAAEAESARRQARRPRRDLLTPEEARVAQMGKSGYRRRRAS